MESFTEEERKLLSAFMTNLDKPVFVLVNLPEVVKGALFSRYSRSAKSLRRVLLDEFILQPEMGFKEIVGHAAEQGVEQHVAIQKAEQFYDRVLVGYGDDSVAELASVHVAIEDISNIATKVIEDTRIGFSPLEKSTRYVYFDQPRDGKWLYYREPKIMQSDYATLYEKTCNRLFETYAKLIPLVSKWVMERNPLEKDVGERAYKSATRAKTCDILRGLLPASTLTNMGAMGNGRAWEYLITKMYAGELQEMRDLAGAMHAELGKVIPSFVKRAGEKYGKEMQDYLAGINHRMQEEADIHNPNHGNGDSFPSSFNSQGLEEPTTPNPKEVELIEYDKDAETKVVAYILYSYTNALLKELLEKAKKMDAREREKIIAAYVGARGNRRHKPGRAFENVHYTFDICTNFGAYRDLQRHRVLTQERQRLGCRNGYTLPREIVQAGYENEFKDAMDLAKQTWETIAVKMPGQAQYVVPLAYKIRWYFTLNLREAFHFCELRSMQQGHPDYRYVAQQMYREIAHVHPVLGRYMHFVDLKEYGMERLEAEKKLDKKLQEIEKRKLSPL